MGIELIGINLRPHDLRRHAAITTSRRLADVPSGGPFAGDLFFALVGDNRLVVKELCDRRGNETGQLCIAVAIA